MQNVTNLTDNQEQFILEAKRQGHRVDLDYSGRGMSGDTCPAVYVHSVYDVKNFKTSADVQTDSMGLGFVVYARN